ncbi:MAG: GNAT family N-acetyltransferase [Myxococcota bacterium]|nr:GNAT family N-acetyltransferase [Myxococcota bacterium]
MIRPALSSDLPVIWRLVRELARYERLEHEVVGTEDDFRVHVFGESPRAEVLLAIETDATVVGMAMYFHTFSSFLARPGIHVEDLFVLPEHRRRGWGRALLHAVAGLALSRGCGRVEWSVLHWNDPARNFYKKLGAATMDDWRLCRVAGEALARLGSEPSL